MVSRLFDIDKELEKLHLNREEYESLLKECSDKVGKVTDVDWSEIADKYSIPWNGDSLRKAQQPTVLGGAFVRQYYEEKLSKDATSLDEDDYFKKLRTEKQEILKEKQKLSDERVELKRVIREEARKESYKDLIINTIQEYESSPLLYDEEKQFNGVIKSDNDLIASCTDIHAGIEIDNYFGKYNIDVLRDRFVQYLDKIFEVQIRHCSENCNVILSELVSGLIHNELRIENNQNIIEQFLSVTDYISQFLSELSYHFENVNVYICPGNHSRISPKKEDSLKGENIDHLAIPFLKAKLQNFDNILFYTNDIEESVAMFSVRGQKVFAAHGDKDNSTSVVQKFTLLFGMRPDLVYLGHRHTNGMSTVYDTKIIQSGTFSSNDNYCLDKRLKGTPSQTISVVTDNGLDCLYDVKFR